jgi:hypothetical protein
MDSKLAAVAAAETPETPGAQRRARAPLGAGFGLAFCS